MKIQKKLYKIGNIREYIIVLYVRLGLEKNQFTTERSGTKSCKIKATNLVVPISFNFILFFLP